MTNDYIVIAYYRKSDEDKHGQVQSIDKQKAWGNERADQEGDRITRVFSDTKSAKMPGRKDFGEMMKFIENSDKPIKIYAWKTSRLARNGVDEGMIKHAIARGKIKYIITRDRSYDEYTNHILLGVDFGEATQFSIDLSKDVKEGMKQKVEKGYRPNRTPNGWLPDKLSDKGERKILVDEKRFPRIQKELYKILDSKGAYRIVDSYRYLESIGFIGNTGRTIAKSTLFALYKNPFICGHFLWNGELKLGKHKPMISAIEFETLQIYIGGNRSLKRKHMNVYNGLIRCNECGCWVTTEPPKIKSFKNGTKRVYNYMRCTKSQGKCSQKCIRLEKVEDQIFRVVASLEIDEDWLEYSFDVLRREQKEDPQLNSKRKEHIQKQKVENESKILNLTEKYMMGKIDEDIYEQLLPQYKKAGFDIECQLKELMSSGDAVLESFFKDMKFAQKVAQDFRTAQSGKKKEIIGNLESNLWLIEGNVFIDLKSSLVVLSQCNRLKTLIEPQKNRSHKGGNGSCKKEFFDGAPSGTPIELIQSYLKIRRFYESVILVS